MSDTGVKKNLVGDVFVTSRHLQVNQTNSGKSIKLAATTDAEKDKYYATLSMANGINKTYYF